MVSLKIPAATYRLQFNQQFRFEDARVLVPYLNQLGISDLYSSPIFRARPGSSHGYDVTDPTCLNPELGTETNFEELVKELKSHEMGLLLDIVSNHMAASPDNSWWMDVLENGVCSPYAAYFDIDWNASGERLSYRRFFDINELVGVRVEIPQVFEAAHSLILRLVHEGKVSGLRIDHIDGLYDPLAYLQRLQANIAAEVKENHTDFYIIVEKILSSGEDLPEEWPVFGTTGYDFLNSVNTLFIDEKGVQSLDESYSRFTGSPAVFGDIVYRNKKQVIEELFPGEAHALGHHLACLAQQHQHTANLPQGELTRALIEITACLPVYRTYIRTLEVSARDRLYLEKAFQEALKRNPNTEAFTISFLKRVLYLDFLPNFNTEQKEAWLNFVLRWQQLTGAIMAKGFEDTALYNYNRMVSLNEVGSDPGLAGASVEDFHHCNQLRRWCWPHTLNATSTHDTKRSEDVRARINVLSEIPDEWQQHLMKWNQVNEPKKQKVNGLPVPEPNMEILLYQTIIGAWPLSEEDVSDFGERIKAYAIKAARESKNFTSWQSPDTEYEDALIVFLGDILDDSDQNEFLADLLQFEKRLAYYGALNSLGQVLLKVTSPGVPDFYQGTELWDFSLVDPDNRRLVDFKRRVKLLDGLMKEEAQGQQSLVEQLLKSWQDGRIKLYVTFKALNVRRLQKDLFQNGDYIPLRIVGKRQEHVCAFGRRLGDAWALTIVPRLLTELVPAGTPPVGRQVWGNDCLLLPEGAPERWLNIFSGENLRVSGTARELHLCDILYTFPVAFLIGIQ
jgi:(1->4)-alpha-D-glucan 1-alpha-D-glucosylmutase